MQSDPSSDCRSHSSESATEWFAASPAFWSPRAAFTAPLPAPARARAGVTSTA